MSGVAAKETVGKSKLCIGLPILDRISQFFLVKLYCCSCLGSIYISVDLFHDNDVKFVELRTYLTSCVCYKEISSLHYELQF